MCSTQDQRFFLIAANFEDENEDENEDEDEGEDEGDSKTNSLKEPGKVLTLPSTPAGTIWARRSKRRLV